MDTLSEDIAAAGKILEDIMQEARLQQAGKMARDAGERPSIQRMRQTAWIDSRVSIAWPHWPPGWTAKIKAAFQKIVRRALQWYIDPIVAQQNQFNKATLQAVETISQEVAALRLENDAGDGRLDTLAAQLAALEEQLTSQP
ncbi:MAG TPA: hypothetical protein ENK32_07430 [Anaerolineae bacterium]|nr:hypothetical protein [Anaerolineae bacterium]